MGMDGVHPRVLRELAEVVAELLSIIFENLWLSGDVPDDWKKSSLSFTRKGGRRNYRPVSFTSVPGKIMEQILLEDILRHMREKRVI